MKKPKDFFQYIRTHKFTVFLRISLFCICVSFIFTILFGLLERDGVFDKAPQTTHSATPTPTSTVTPKPTLAPTPVPHETKEFISVNMGSEPLPLNSIMAEDTVTKTILRHMLEGLVRLDTRGKPVPGVATAWTPSEDQLTWTFTLRENSFWQDGSPVVAGDFKATIDTHLNPANNSPYRTQMEALFAAVEVTNDTTISFSLKQPVANFPALLAETQFMPIQKAVYDVNPDFYGIDPAKLSYNGPWYVVLWTHNQRIVMLQNKSYWNNKNIALKQLIFISSGNADSKFANFKTGNYDLVFLTAQEAAPYREANYTVVDYADGTIVSLDFNTENSLLQFNSLRQALSLSIDRTAFVKNTLKTGATAIEGYDIALDLPLAQQALAIFQTELQAFNLSHPENPLSLENGLTITVDESEASILYASALVEQWKQALGIHVTVEPLSYAQRIEKIQKGTMQITITASTEDVASLEAPLYYRHSLYATNNRVQNVISVPGRDLDLYYAKVQNTDQFPT